MVPHQMICSRLSKEPNYHVNGQTIETKVRRDPMYFVEPFFHLTVIQEIMKLKLYTKYYQKHVVLRKLNKARGNEVKRSRGEGARCNQSYLPDRLLADIFVTASS